MLTHPVEVFDTLEKVFRPESNQTLSHFKFRNMKQNASQNCDSYMSELRLALPECKYRTDSDELLKDQFIFGIHNKEIQDHLLGEIKETDNSVRALYEARKIESKLAQRKMLGIANPNLVSVARIASNAVVRTTLEKCVGPRDLASLNLSQSMTQECQARLSALINVEYMRLMSVMMTWRT